MSFYTALTGLNAATAQLEITSNNISNVGTAGFKRSRADFGDIFATSPLQKASSVIGQGVALKEVTQEFSQGNIQASNNALDLAISGDGFFMLKSSDGLQNIYTRNGSFTLNDQYNVVNSAGQALQAASVDSSGKADLGNLNRLAVPKKTTGDAKQTSLVSLGLNFPADAAVIPLPFNRNNPTTYNKTTALTVYDQGGNNYLATVYYAKTQNASQALPTNTWQTYVFIGDDQVNASLTQASDENGEMLFVNKYGQLAPANKLSADQTQLNVKTMMFELDQLTDQRVSVPATIVGAESGQPVRAGDAGINFASGIPPLGQLQNMLTIDVDNSGRPIVLDMSALALKDQPITGAAIANAITNQLNRSFGDARYWSLNTASRQRLSIEVVNSGGTATEKTINLLEDTTFAAIADKTALSTSDILGALQRRLDADTPGGFGPDAVTASYNVETRSFAFVDSAGGVVSVRGGLDNSAVRVANDVFGVSTSLIKAAADGTYTTTSGTPVVPNGNLIRPVAAQRYGLSCTFDSANKLFKFSSGTTGDTSSIKISNQSDFAKSLFNLPLKLATEEAVINTSEIALRGVVSTAATCRGAPLGINVASNFAVTSTNNRFVVSVDDVKGTVTIPPDDNYTLAGLKAALQRGINELGNASGSTVSGVMVDYDSITNSLVFTTGTSGSDAFIQVSGDTVWGLSAGTSGRGSTSQWIKPTQATVTVNGITTEKYIDKNGKEVGTSEGFNGLPEWSPIFLHKGELTFDTAGKLVSPKTGAQLDTVFLADGKGALRINIDYSKSTQFSSPFAVLSQSQDGAPEGDLIGVNIGDDGLVNASYSNGTQKSLGKIALINFSNPNGLRQIGDSSFYSSSASGSPTFGEAGSAGFGTIRAGATERANVDLTEELVDLITGQRNFQASAKAIETNTTLTQAIIQIRT